MNLPYNTVHNYLLSNYWVPGIGLVLGEKVWMNVALWSEIRQGAAEVGVSNHSAVSCLGSSEDGDISIDEEQFEG